MAAVSILHPNGILLTAYQQGHKMAVTRRPQGGAVQVKENDTIEMDEKSVRDLFQIKPVVVVEFHRISALLTPR